MIAGLFPVLLTVDAPGGDTDCSLAIFQPLGQAGADRLAPRTRVPGAEGERRLFRPPAVGKTHPEIRSGHRRSRERAQGLLLGGALGTRRNPVMRADQILSERPAPIAPLPSWRVPRGNRSVRRGSWDWCADDTWGNRWRGIPGRLSSCLPGRGLPPVPLKELIGPRREKQVGRTEIAAISSASFQACSSTHSSPSSARRSRSSWSAISRASLVLLGNARTYPSRRLQSR